MALHFKRVVIYGVGLLGGSLGMALRRRGLSEVVVGLGRSRKRLERAIQLGALDEFTTDPSEALEDADGLILCLPPRLIRRKWSELAPLIKPGVFVTDVGSVKEGIVASAHQNLEEGVLMVGCHPMAGSEESGVEAARGDLFDKALCFITPIEQTAPKALIMATQFWRAVGSRIAVVEPKRHDKLLAAISHLPHLLATAQVQGLYSRGDSTPLLRAVIGNGFRDSTRIAAGDPKVWEQIFTENSEAVVETLDASIEILRDWRELLSRHDASDAVVSRLTETSRRRRQLSADEGSLPS